MMDNMNYKQIPAEKFAFAQQNERIHDKKIASKPVGYFKDAWRRFKKNKSAVIAFVLIMILVLFSVLVPIFSPYTVKFRDDYFQKTLPRFSLFAWLGWDGCETKDVNQSEFDILTSIAQETGKDIILSQSDPFTIVTKVKNDQGEEEEIEETRYTVKYDTYYRVGTVYKILTEAQYKELLDYQNENRVQVFYPIPNTWNQDFSTENGGAKFWYKLKNEVKETTGEALRDENGNMIPNYITDTDPRKAGYNSDMRIAGDNGGEDGNTWYIYAKKVQGGYKVRIDYYEYYKYVNGAYPSFLFGTNAYGQDMFTCLAVGGRFSFLLAISVCLINFTIGAIYGAIEGYYGGKTDMIMERISDILASVPFMVVAVLFQMHLAKSVGVLGSLLFAYILTGWISMASRVRTQFYRFKGQEYVLAARTLGARDRRLIMKHIFPNSLGTIVTGSVLAIPGVIFSESMLSYLNIINLETDTSLTSIGTLLSGGQSLLSTYPHIILFPALFISILEISFNLFGNGLRDALNPSLRGADE